MWDVEPESDATAAADPQRIAAHVLEHTRPGSIILLHPMYASREASRQALPTIIEAAGARLPLHHRVRAAGGRPGSV